MSRLQTFPLPDVGEGLTEAEILEWRVAEGDTLTVNQIMVEIETAKAAVELPSPHAGRVHKILAEPGITLEVGTPIIQIDTDPEAGPLPDDMGNGGAAGAAQAVAPATQTAAASAPAADGGDGAKIGETTSDGRVATLVGYIAADKGGKRRARRGTSTPQTPAAAPAPTSPAVPVPAPTPAAGEPQMAPLATPPVRKYAKDLGVDLRGVTATRADGVISRADIDAALAGPAPTATPAAAGSAVSGRVIPYDPATRQHRVPVKGVRKMTAAAMVESAFTAPHVTEFLTVDVTAMMQLRDRLRADRAWQGVKLSPLAFAARAICLASVRTPEANCVWDEAAGEIVYQDYVHLGIAAATDRGLIVPVIHDADQLDLRGLALSLMEVAETARAGRTTPAQMAGGTITITNVGVFGVDTGTPIIPPGQSAILALGSIKDAPWVVDGELAVRKVCQLALSFDHRVIDGQQGSEFLADVGALLADPGLAITY